MKILSLLILILSLNFLFIQHPLSIGFILLILTILSCLLSSLILNYYLLSYILFLVFIGGILILFIYIARIASNEKFYFSIKLFLINIIFVIILYLFNVKFHFISNYFFNINNYNEYNISIINKLYSIPHGNLSLIMVIYLLFTIIVIANIIRLKIAPLRRSYV